MTKWIMLTLFATGCATILNKRTVHVELDDGVSVDGESVSADIDQREPHTVTYADGRTCNIHPGVSGPYIVLDIFLTGPIGLIIDAITGDWTVAKGDCPGVYEKK